jgi:hypothetical protein
LQTQLVKQKHLQQTGYAKKLQPPTKSLVTVQLLVFSTKQLHQGADQLLAHLIVLAQQP